MADRYTLKGEELKVYGEMYYNGVAVPQNTSTNSTARVTGEGAQNGSLEIVCEVMTELALADTKVFSIKVQESTDNSTWTDRETIYSKTASGAETVAVGTILARYALASNTAEYTRLVMTSDDAAMTGAVDGFLVYIPR